MKTISVFILLCVASISAYSQESAISPKALPAEVVKAFHAAYPKSKIRSASKEAENGSTNYEINCTDGTSKKTISFSSTGKIIETEEQISVGKLPGAVSKTLASGFAGSTILRVESSVKETGTVYEVLM